ncbi:11322_t:CDS:1, partial [Acaulospora colombiana]
MTVESMKRDCGWYISGDHKEMEPKGFQWRPVEGGESVLQHDISSPPQPIQDLK